MALMTLLGGAQGGRYFANAGAAAGVAENEARQALGVLGPAIAQKLRAKAEADTRAFEDLVDLLEDGGTGSELDDTKATTGAEAISDGTAILTEIYGTRNAAVTEARRLAPNLAETAVTKLAAIAATSVLAALVRGHARVMPLASAQQAAAVEGGLLGSIVAAIVKGAVEGAVRQLARKPARKRRTYSSYFGRKRRKPAKRRSPRARTPTLDDIFAEILGSKRK